ncbi:MAG: hypothetical protein ACJ8FL_02180 [Sphingomicrobium sp.]
MSSAPASQEIARDARWLTQALEPSAGVVRLIEMDRESYRAASFLDDRMLQQPVNAHVVPWDAAAGAAALCERRDARWIFHIGHVGSTLVARLLGELPGVLSLREPRLLRDLIAISAARRSAFTDAAQALFSRTFAAEEQALVKATSFVSEIAPALVPSGERALFMFTAPDAYVASILAGENSLQELKLLARSRSGRMSGRVHGLDDAERSAAHLAAAAWACEMTSLEAAAEAMHDRAIDWLDFDRMLEDVEGAMSRTAGFLGFESEPELLRGIVSGPLMRRYSKALDYDYSPALRRELLDEARRLHGRDIAGAMAMLESAAGRSPLLERALERAKLES